MEKHTNICTKYSNKLAYYAGYGFLIGGICNLLFFKRIKTGLLIGFGVGAGYCHKEFVKCFYDIFTNEKLIEFE